MSKPDTSIDPRILECAKQEFLSCGYEKASTVTICKNAGVTTGALYKRYSGKEALFCAIVSSAADDLKKQIQTQIEKFHRLPDEKKSKAAFDGQTGSFPYIDFVYDHFEEFKILLECPKGTRYENYMNELVDIIVESTMVFMEETNCKAVIHGEKVSPELIHMVTSAYLSGIFEPVFHDMSREEAKIYVDQLQYFFNIGWEKILQPQV